ncbi:MAG: CoA ester lyase [Deltaproteobacteria bacterium]|nr:CoA ester lyase [Deltaproteobacteria bacterium]
MDRILRSLLYVPANSWRMITNALTEGADALILDLEDACPMAEKETARIFARDSIPMIKEQGLEVFVRVNSLSTGLTGTDLEYVVAAGLDGIMLAKTESAQDLVACDRMIAVQETAKGLEPGQTGLIALLETPRAIMNLKEMTSASPRLLALAFGSGDYSREIGAGMGVTKLSPEEYFPMILYPRSAIATAARASGILALDTPFFGLVIDLEGLAVEAAKVKLLGFSGKQVTHPRHVGPVNKAFSPDPAEVELARQVIEAYQAASSKGLGAASMGGKMIDLSSAKRAEALLAADRAIREKQTAGRAD